MKKYRDRIVFANDELLEKNKPGISEAEIAGQNIIMTALANHDPEAKTAEHNTAEHISAMDANSKKMAMLIMIGEFEKLDLAFNNAGVGSIYPGGNDIASAINDRQMALEITSRFYCVKNELQQFLKQAGASG